jgi:hypothetical protein
VSGRWFGVRGRRFIRPTLTLTLSSDGSQRRALAELEHKPWAAEDGELWIASFPVEVKLEDAAEMELAVAPDIAIELGHGHGSGKRRAQKPACAPDARQPRVRTDSARARPRSGERAQSTDRLQARLAAAEQATEHERTRRDATERELENERSQSLRLRAEVGRLRAELELAAAAQQELSSASSSLDATRTEAHATGRRLEAATRALEEQRVESERLRERLGREQATVERLMQSEAAALSGRPGTTPAPTHARVERLAPAQARVERPGHRRSGTSADLPAARPERQLDPAPNPLGRALALVVMVAVIAAVVLVIHSTIA